MMPDFATIGAVFSSLKTATEITKFLRETDLSLERADLKLKLAELIEALADAKIVLVEVQETLAGKDQRIAELEEAFNSKDDLVRRYDAYYAADLERKADGCSLLPSLLGDRSQETSAGSVDEGPSHLRLYVMWSSVRVSAGE